ncbi:hypothetical protein ES703_77402 [subsurface metagenome]
MVLVATCSSIEAESIDLAMMVYRLFKYMTSLIM